MNEIEVERQTGGGELEEVSFRTIGSIEGDFFENCVCKKYVG